MIDEETIEITCDGNGCGRLVFTDTWENIENGLKDIGWHVDGEYTYCPDCNPEKEVPDRD